MNGLAAGLLAAGSGYLKGRAQASDAATEQARYDDTQARYADQQQRQQRQDAMSQDMQAAQLGAMRDTAARNMASDQRQAAGDARSDYEGGYRAVPDVAALGNSMTAPGAATTAGWDGTDMASTLHGMAQMGADLQQQARGPAAFTRGGVGMVKSGESLDDIARNDTQDFKRESLAAQLAAKRESDQQHGADALERAQVAIQGRQQTASLVAAMHQGQQTIAKRGFDERESNRLRDDFRSDAIAKRLALRADIGNQVRGMLDIKDNPMAMNAAITDLAKYADPSAVARASKTNDIKNTMSFTDMLGQIAHKAATGKPLSDKQVESMRQIVDKEIETGRAQLAPVQARFGALARQNGLTPLDSAVIAPDYYGNQKTRAEQAADSPNVQKLKGLLQPQGQQYGRPQPSAPPSPLTTRKPLDSFWVKQP